MESIRFLLFTFHLAFALAVFYSEQIHELLYSGPVTWEIAENSSKGISYQLIQRKPKEITFDPKNAYIVLHKRKFTNDFSNSFQTYYLVSEYLSERIRRELVTYIIEIRNIILLKYQQNIHLIRETYNRESFRFKLLFPQISDRENSNNISSRRLYRVSKVNGDVRFQQVPLQFSQFSSSDAYVYVDIPQIIHFVVNLDDRDRDPSYVARSVMSFIKLENKFEDKFNGKSYSLDSSYCSCRFGSEVLKESHRCYSEFLSKVEQCPDAKDVEKTILNNVAEETPDVPEYQLYSPSRSETTMNLEFEIESLDTFDFGAKACYVFIMPKVEEIFIYIRDFTYRKQLETCLQFGEELTAENKYLVSVFQKEYPATPFIFLFKKFRPLFFPNYKNPDKLSYFYKSSHELNKMMNTIKDNLP